MTNRERSQVGESSGFAPEAGHDRLTALSAASYSGFVKKCSHILPFVLVGLLLFVVLAGCSKGNAWENPGPKESFEAYMMDLWRGNRAEAFEAVWPDDRQWLTAAEEVLEKGYPKVPALKPEQWLVVSRVDNPFDIRRLETVSKAGPAFERGDRVTIEIHYYDDRVRHAEMVWGGERWYVAIPEPSAKPVVDVVDSGSGVDEEALQLRDDDVSNGDD